MGGRGRERERERERERDREGERERSGGKGCLAHRAIVKTVSPGPLPVVTKTD